MVCVRVSIFYPFIKHVVYEFTCFSPVTHLTRNRLTQPNTFDTPKYRQRHFATYSDLIYVLLTAEQTNELLLKNHNLRPVGSKALPEAHANSEKIIGHFKGYKRRQEYNPRRGGRKFNRPRKSNFGPNHDKEKKPKKVTNESICHRCGMTGHWSRTCRTPKYFVDLYQASLKNTGKRGE